MERIIEKVVAEYKNCAFLRAIVLGGSRATGTATETSDIDIGLYYDSGQIDYPKLNFIARQIDDRHRENLICRPGEWGEWVNCGGWLTIDGCPVDLIMRDWARVTRVIADTDQGKFSCHYHTGHPHAYVDAMYRGELAVSKVLYARDQSFLAVKKHAENYPCKLRDAIIGSFLSEAQFTCTQAEKAARTDDIYYLEGQAFRLISAMNQALFALNEEWLLNEKKAVFRIMGLNEHPEEYAGRVRDAFASVGTSPLRAAQELKKLCEEVTALCAKRNRHCTCGTAPESTG